MMSNVVYRITVKLPYIKKVIQTTFRLRYRAPNQAIIWSLELGDLHNNRDEPKLSQHRLQDAVGIARCSWHIRPFNVN